MSAEVAKAIGTHIMWRSRLFTAIQSGESTLTPAIAERDDLCELGKWLLLEASAKVKGSPRYEKCLDLHRHFHQVAGRVLTLALSGKRNGAQKAMEGGSELSSASSALVKELTALDKEVLDQC